MGGLRAARAALRSAFFAVAVFAVNLQVFFLPGLQNEVRSFFHSALRFVSFPFFFNCDFFSP